MKFPFPYRSSQLTAEQAKVRELATRIAAARLEREERDRMLRLAWYQMQWSLRWLKAQQKPAAAVLLRSASVN